MSGRIASVTLTNAGGGVFAVANTFTHDPMGPVTGFRYGNGLTRSQPRDLDGRLTTARVTGAGVGIQTLNYSYDANDRITRIANGVNGTLTQDYAYDELNRLTGVTSNSGHHAWQFDANGNRTQHVQGSGTTAYETSNVSSRLMNLSGGQNRAYVYDANGNTVRAGNDTYTYNAFNRMDGMKRGALSTRYWVNALGQRTRKRVGDYPDQTGFVYAPDGKLLAEYSWQASRWTNYIWLGEQLIGMTRGNSRYFRASISMPSRGSGTTTTAPATRRRGGT